MGADVTALREELVRRRLSGQRRADSGAIGAADRSGPLPLSWGQQQMWFLSRLAPESPEYLVPLVLRLRGRLDVSALRRGWQHLVERHEILRTRYQVRDNEPVQVIDPFVPPPFPVIDVAEERLLAEVTTAQTTTGFDLEQQWPARASLLRLSEEDHQLVVVFHHIACDAWSVQVFLTELRALYDASTLAPLPLQYADYAAWQRQDQAADQQLDYWRERLADFALLELPTDRQRPPVRDWRGDAVTFTLPEGVGELAQRHEVTTFTVVLAAFQALLSRYARTTDVSVGTVVSGRGRPELQGLIGYGINSVVLRTRWNGDPTFADLLAHTRTTVLEALQHNTIPFARLVGEFQPDRDMSRTPLFQVACILHDDKTRSVELPGVSVETVQPDWEIAKFDLSLEVERSDSGPMRAGFVYATALFDKSTVERMATHLSRLVEAAVENPDVRLSTVDILTDFERHELVTSTVVDSPVHTCLHEVFEDQVCLAPNAIAVTFEGTELSYAELNARANQLAHRLRAMGVGVESLVGVCLNRGIDLVVALLAVVKSGAAYLPLDPALPTARLEFMLADAGAAIVITESQHAGRLPGKLVVLDTESDAIAELPVTNLESGVCPDNLVYVIYTSGSTGQPKGVCLSHRNVSRLLTSAQHHYGFDHNDVWPWFHSYAFDVSVWELWGALTHGGRLVVVPQEVIRSPEDFLALLTEQRVTVLNQTPSAFRSLAGADLALRAVVFAGEKLEVPELRPWADRHGLDRPMLVNMYGSTETAIHTTFHRIEPRDLLPGAGNPIGRPVLDSYIRLLDEHGGLVPTGVTGEIHIGGPGLARGYLNRPSLTAERFVPDPYGTPGARLYRSGDLASRRPDGDLIFLGRADDQVKIRGYRAEPGEIEAALKAHPGVREAVVVVSEGRLVAYVIAEKYPEPGELRAALSVSLPEYMVPSAFVAVTEIPLTSNGKLDRRALPAPGTDSFTAGTEHLAPRTQDEQRLHGIWQQVIGLDQIGVEDSFFDLGGDSITAVVLVGALRAEGFDVTVRDVFEHRTIAALAGFTAGRQAAVEFRPTAPFELITEADRAALPADVVDAYPVARTQTGILVEIMMDDTGLNHYHNVTSFRVRDERPFSLERLQSAVDAVVARHDIFRTSFALAGYSEPLQLVHATGRTLVVDYPLHGLSAAEQEAEITEFTRAEHGRLFDPSTYPLLRIAAHVGAGGWWISVTEYQAILEGWSYHSMLTEIIDRYRGQSAPNPSPVRYADFIAAERAALSSATDQSYWDGVVAGHARFSLPPEWRADSNAPESYRVYVPYHDLDDGLRALARQAGASLKSVLFAAHLKVMSMLTHESSFLTGLVGHGRVEAAGADRVYGMHLNTLPFVMDRKARTWRALVERLFSQESEHWRHRHFPMPEIQRRAGGGRLLEVLFNYLDFHQVDTAVIDVMTAIGQGTSEFALGVSTQQGNLCLGTSTAALSRENGDRLGAMYRAVLVAMADDPDGDALSTYLPDDERRPLLGPQQQAAPDMVTAFQAHAESCPDSVAVIDGDRRVTYGELNREANRLARHLLGLGVETEDLVGVCMQRSVESVMAALAVLKAGAAYLPLDPDYPSERLEFMAADAGAKVVLTELDSSAWAHHSGDNLESTVDTDAVAYAIYTSGSTGQPKASLNTRRGLANRLGWERERLGRLDVVLHKASISFDAAIWEVFAPLAAGARLVLAGPGEHGDPSRLRDLIAEHGVTAVAFVPSLLAALAQDVEPLRSLRIVVAAGEEFPVRLKRDLLTRMPWCELYNQYGPSEASVDATAWHCLADEPDGARVPIGRPLPNVQAYVLDGLLNPVPVGAPGELHLGGPGLARGYHRRPALTAERFVPGPDGQRLYRTGDLVRSRPDGALDFLGRVDNQVKVRGVRVELGEIEATLTGYPAIADAVVTVHEDNLVAYCVLAGADQPDLRELLGRTLPDHMVPSTFVMLDQIPRNPNGKLDRSALPAPLELTDYVPPRTETEARIVAVWAEMLEVPRVGVHDSFFDLGGDSIRAVSLVGALRTAGFDVSVPEVFERRTVAKLAELITGRPVAERTAAVEPFALISLSDKEKLPDGVLDAYPLSQVQAGMLMEMLGDHASRRYHGASSFRVRDDRPFSLPALQQAAELMVARHEVLRTSFEPSAYSVPMQLVHATAPIIVHSKDLRGLDQELALAEYIANERANLFDLSKPPLLRLCAHIESDNSWRLGITQPHAITEGWSFYSLLAELFDCYWQIRDGHAPRPHEPTRSRYADFVAHELESLASDEDAEYWRGIVDDYPAFVLPQGLSEPGESVTHRVRVPYDDLENGLRAVASRARTSLKSVLLAVHVKVLSMFSSESRFHTGLVCDARPELPDAERVHGMYLNTLPFAVDRIEGTWIQLVQQVFDREVRLWPHRRFPLPEIQRRAGGGRLLDVLFIYQDFQRFDAGVVDPGSTLSENSTEFSLHATAIAGQFILRTNTGMLSRAAAERLGAMYRLVLEAVVADPDGDARASVLPATERHTLLHDWGVGASYPLSTTLPALFEEQAARTPEATAVVFGDRELTYRQLDEESNRLARHLVELGVGPEVPVGLCAERGIELAVGLLGILKAGGAYLPLDPEYPAERIAYLLADAGAPVVVTSHQLPVDGPTVVHLDADRQSIDARPVRSGLSDRNPAYLIYTSGSTGRPKAVVVDHAGIVNRVMWTVRRHGLSEDDRVLQKTTLTFDAACWEFFGPWASGGTVVLAPIGAERDPAALVAAVARHGITVLQLVPSVLRLLVDEPGWRDVTSLRLVFSAGEPLRAELCQQLLERVDVEVWNTYGPTECSIDVTASPFDRAEVSGPVSIGRPIDNIVVRVLDDAGDLVAAGVPGELHIGGTGLARGYHGRPALTAERFVPGPDGTRLYRTGDVVCWETDGQLRFLGRADHQVKINGVRVEPGEVEAALVAHPAVRAAVVLVRQDRLVAYLESADVPAPDSSELTALLARSLPTQLIPGLFVWVDQFPLLSNGKLDIRALPDASGQDFVAPGTATERALAEIWCRLLDIDRVGVNDGFFESGGHSLLVIRLISAAHEAGLPITLMMLNQHKTLGELAAALDDTTAGSVATTMAEHNVPGMCVTVIRDGELASLRCFGVREVGGTDPITPDTPFRVASVSKFVTALGLLRLVALGKLDLDDDVRHFPGAGVTPRLLLNHLAGLGPEQPLTVELPPGEVFRKNGLHFVVLQQVMVDVTGTPFPELMRELVFDPLGMTGSTFEQAPPVPAAMGHDEHGAPIAGEWQPSEAASVGLWTTAGDLVKVVREVRRARLGQTSSLLTRELAEQMLTVGQQGSFYGLGTVVDDTGPDLSFGHAGRPLGYRAVVNCLLHNGSGFVALTNGMNGEHAVNAFLKDGLS